VNEHEGVIKYHLSFSTGPAVNGDQVREINAWRRILFLLGLIGQDPARYGGFGFGNVSRRLQRGGNAFVISGTQTAQLPELGPEHYSVVTVCDPMRNQLAAKGPVKPSSEALTHGAMYQVDHSIQYVFHVHSPDIWRQASRLAIPATAAKVSYGTPEMANEIAGLLAGANARQKHMIIMGGHEDGVVAFGASAEQTGQALIRYFSQALQLPKNL